MKSHTAERARYSDLLKFNQLFRDLDEALGKGVPVKRKLAAWEVVQRIAALCIQRTVKDCTHAISKIS